MAGRRSPLGSALAIVVAAGVIGGCGGGGGDTSSSAQSAHVPAAVARAQQTHEYPAAPAPPERTAGAASSPQAAVRGFAERYINWSADSVTATLRRLARESVGQARSAMELEASQVAADPALARGGIANSGTVEAVAPLPGAAGRFVVVTRERTTATASAAYAGLRPSWHVTVASVRLMSPGRWAVSSWQPQN